MHEDSNNDGLKLRYFMATSFIQSHRSSQPEPQGWILAILSALLLSTTAYFCVLAGTYMYHQSASNMLLEELDIGRFGAARKLLERCVTAPPFKSILFLNKSYATDSAEVFEGSISQHLYDALVYLHEGKLLNAKEQIEKIDPSSLISNLADLRENLEVKGPHKRVEYLIRAEKNKKLSANSIEELDSQLERILDKHMKTSRDFADFFSLDSAYIDTPHPTSPLVYRNGVLKDLPQLKFIPDGLTDLDNLQRELLKAGGRVRTSQTNAAREYEEKVSSFKDRSLSEIYEFNRLSDRRSEAAESKNNLTAKYNSEKRLLEETLKRIVQLRASQAYFKHLDPPFWLQDLVNSTEL